jgi:hypothetical protein
MPSSPKHRDEPSLEDRLGQLDEQLRNFEASLKTQQQNHVRVRELELELAGVVERGRMVVGELTRIGDQMRQAAETAKRETLAESAARTEEFEQQRGRLLEAYDTAIREAQQVVERAEARITAFDEKVARELAQAGHEIREAATILKDDSSKRADNVTVAARSRRLLPALLAAALILGAVGAYSWLARMLRDASSRAAAAERQAHEVQREANQQIASIERAAQQANAEGLAAAARAERSLAVLAAPDLQRMRMTGWRNGKDSSGQAVWSASRGVVIIATQLPTLAPAETYQVWLVTQGDSVSLGTVSPDARGRVNAFFDLPAGFDGTLRGFMLSREPRGGSPRPSRTVVLAS